MEIIEKACAGTEDKSDCLITVSKGEGKVTVHLISNVLYEYGNQIVDIIHKTLERLDINDITVDVEDRGAFDYVIIARLEAAIYRSIKQTDQIPWGGLFYE